MAPASGRTSSHNHNEGWAFGNTTALDPGPRGCILLCGLELPATDKWTRQINATHAHLALLTRAADGRTAGQPLPSEIWSLITEKQSCADYILAKIPSESQKMVIRNDSRTCLCRPNKCPVGQHLADWLFCLAGSGPIYVWTGSVDRFKFGTKAVGTVWQMSLSRHSSAGKVRKTLWQRTKITVITNKAGGKMFLSRSTFLTAKREICT